MFTGDTCGLLAACGLLAVVLSGSLLQVKGHEGTTDNSGALVLDVRLLSSTPSNLARPISVTCSLDAALTSFDKVTSLTLFASTPFGHVGDNNEFDTLVSLNLWNTAPQLFSGLTETEVDVSGSIGSGSNSKSLLTFFWKYPTAGQDRLYKCIASGLNGQAQVVSLSTTSRAAVESQSHQCSPLVVEQLSEIANSTAILATTNQLLVSSVDRLEKSAEAALQALQTQSLSIEKLQQQRSLSMNQWKFSYLMANFDISEVFNGKVYFVSKSVAPFNIQAAGNLCGILGGYLVELDDSKEFDFVDKFIRAVGGTNYFFTGGNDLENEGSWTFWQSKKRVTYFIWNARQPDNANNLEHCIELRLDPRGMNDRPCNYKSKYICEAAAQAIYST